MPFLLGCAALFFPRLILFLVWLFGGGWLTQAFEHWLWPLLGFFFVPLTTLTYAFSYNSLGQVGEVPPLGWVLIIIAVLVDFGLLGGGASARKKREKKE